MHRSQLLSSTWSRADQTRSGPIYFTIWKQDWDLGAEGAFGMASERLQRRIGLENFPAGPTEFHLPWLSSDLRAQKCCWLVQADTSANLRLSSQMIRNIQEDTSRLHCYDVGLDGADCQKSNRL